MWTNLLLLVSAATAVLKLAIEHWISAEEAAVALLGVVLFIAVTSVFDTPQLRPKTRATKVAGSIVSLAVAVSNGNLQLAAICVIACIGVGVMLFGMYFMVAGSRDKGAVLFAAAFLGIGIIWWIAEQIKLQGGTGDVSVAAILNVLQQRAFPQRTITLNIPAYGTSQVVSTTPLYRIVRWDIDEMRGIAMYSAAGQQVFGCDQPWASMVNTKGDTYEFYFRSCRNSATTLTLNWE